MLKKSRTLSLKEAQGEMEGLAKIQIETQYAQDGAWDSAAGPRPYLRGKALGELGKTWDSRR